MINADDYYGKEGFKAVHEYLVNGGKSCIAGFVLKNTLSDNGGVVVDVNSLVSMNMWGLTPDFLDVLENGFKEFFQKEVPGNPQKAEYLIPIFIGELLEQGKMSVKVLKTNDTWYGMTYHEDVAAVKDSFKKCWRMACIRLIYLLTCDILRAVAPYAARNNITHLFVVSSRQRFYGRRRCEKR